MGRPPSLCPKHKPNGSPVQEIPTCHFPIARTGTVGTKSTNAAGADIEYDTAGSGNAHTNLQPYLVLNYIIKI